MHPEIQELVELLNATKLLLAKYGETQWSEWLAKDSLLIENLDLHGVEHLLSAYGGMGSINDVLIHPANGHKIQEADVAKVNDELRSLLSKVIALSKKLYAEEANTSRRA
jgi:hypothetical protein